MDNTGPWILAAALLLASPAWAAGGGGGSGGGGGAGGPQTAADPDYLAGEAAVKRKDWPRAIAHMSAVLLHDDRNADAWNYMGYAYRQMGDMDNSFKHYEKALQLNPRHRGAHEYLGEAYLQVGQLAQAEEHLKVLDKLCWLPCEQYSDLKEKILAYKREHPSSSR